MKILTHGLARRIMPLIVFVAMGMLIPLVAAVPAAMAQSARLDLSGLDKLAEKASNVTNVNLDSDALQLAAGHVSGNQKNMLQKLKGLYVRDFEFSKPGEYTRADVEGILRQLQSAGWKAIVNVEDKKNGETTDIYLMHEGDATVGMAVVDAEPKELTVVNMVGPIDLSELGGMGGHFGIPPVALEHRDGSPASTRPPAKDESKGQ